MNATGGESLLLLLGGSFNPLHIGHMRIALEAREALRPWKTYFIPSAVPPHKLDAKLLPFAMRADMIRSAIAALPREWGLEVCEVENERPGPSYTIDTLSILSRRHPGQRPVFIMGGEDYAQLGTWKDWGDIPRFADLAVLPRSSYGRESFNANTLSLWPDAVEILSPYPRATLACSIPGGGKALFIDQPLIELSSSFIRMRFLEGRSLEYLLPAPVQDYLTRERQSAQSIWA